jgi:hypothetical protein
MRQKIKIKKSKIKSDTNTLFNPIFFIPKQDLEALEFLNLRVGSNDKSIGFCGSLMKSKV